MKILLLTALICYAGTKPVSGNRYHSSDKTVREAYKLTRDAVVEFSSLNNSVGIYYNGIRYDSQGRYTGGNSESRVYLQSKETVDFTQLLGVTQEEYAKTLRNRLTDNNIKSIAREYSKERRSEGIDITYNTWLEEYQLGGQSPLECTLFLISTCFMDIMKKDLEEVMTEGRSIRVVKNIQYAGNLFGPHMFYEERILTQTY